MKPIRNDAAIAASLAVFLGMSPPVVTWAHERACGHDDEGMRMSGCRHDDHSHHDEPEGPFQLVQTVTANAGSTAVPVGQVSDALPFWDDHPHDDTLDIALSDTPLTLRSS